MIDKETLITCAHLMIKQSVRDNNEMFNCDFIIQLAKGFYCRINIAMVVTISK